MTMFDLQKRVAFVTGGNGGIGLGMAKGLASAGASIVIAGRNKSKAQSALAELHTLGAKAEFIELDVLDENSCRDAVQRTADRFGRLDIVVNNAGTTVRKQPQDLTAKDWRLVMETNLTSAFLCSQAAYPHMVRAGGGKIINIGSMMTIFASSYAAPYAASKGGIVQLARSMAVGMTPPRPSPARNRSTPKIHGLVANAQASVRIEKLMTVQSIVWRRPM